MDGETVIESVQTDAAQQVASEVSAQVAVGDSVIASEVAVVSAQVAEHAQVSEERHEEILEGQSEWHVLSAELLNQMQAIRTEQQEIRNSLLAMRETLLTILEHQSNNPNPSAVSPSSNPPTSEPEPETPIVENPESVVADLPVPETPRRKGYRKI